MGRLSITARWPRGGCIGFGGSGVEEICRRRRCDTFLSGFCIKEGGSLMTFISSRICLRLSRLALALVFAGGMMAVRPVAAQQVVFLRNARVIDGTGAAPREHISLLLRNGRIEKIGETMAVPAGAEVRDLTGKTEMPGLISAHSHPGLIVDDAESSATGYTRENVTAQLKQFERYGVTTILSLGVNRDLVYELREEQRKGRLGGAAIMTAGRGIGVPGGAPGLPAMAD